jgi:hypothetical protein
MANIHDEHRRVGAELLPERAMNDELRVRGQPLEKRFAGNVMLVLPNRWAAKRQRVALEATEQEPSTREPAHIVGAEHDARQIPDCIGHTRFEREDLSLGGPAGMVPPEVPEDSDHRYAVIDSGSDPVIDLAQQVVGRLQTRHGVKPITAPHIYPAPFEAGQHARVRRIVSQQDAHLVALEARGEKTGCRVERLVILPEVADVVTRRRECVADAQRNAALERRSIVKTAGSEEAEESGLLTVVRLSVATPELPERTHHDLHLRQIPPTSGARPQVLVATRTLGRA